MGVFHGFLTVQYIKQHIYPVRFTAKRIVGKYPFKWQSLQWMSALSKYIQIIVELSYEET